MSILQKRSEKMDKMDDELKEFLRIYGLTALIGGLQLGLLNFKKKTDKR